jgi:Arc/MetJ-type ribon-helix-helix transcriptional regulator
MERMDSAATGLIEQEVRDRFPEGALAGVAVLQYGDDPAVEPGQILVQVTVEPTAEAEGDEDRLEAFHRANRDAIAQLQRDIPKRWPQATRFKIISGQGGDGRKRMMMVRMPTPDDPKEGDLTPVMARLGPADLETLDTLITAGFAASRAQAVRWALARIRERPAYAELRERAKEIENLKSQF